MVSEMNSKKVRVQPNYSWLFKLHLSACGAVQLAKLGRYLGDACRTLGVFGSTPPWRPRILGRLQSGYRYRRTGQGCDASSGAAETS